MATHPHPPAAASALPPRRFTFDDANRVLDLSNQDSRIGRKTKEALDITDQAIQTYGLEHVALSFNGGKDCTVLVHLLAAAILRHLSSSPSSVSSSSSPASSSSSSTSTHLPPIPTVYVRCPSPFPQVEAFVSLCVGWYNLDLEAIEGGMKEALGAYLEHQGRRAEGAREVKAVLVGVRRADPHGATLTPLCPTDPTWPQFMRVHPILDWTYGDVWAFLRATELTLGSGSGAVGKKGEGGRLGLEWCELYDYGYTSLGSTHNTFPNPLLRATTTDGHYVGSTGAQGGGKEVEPAPLGGWRPAWELEDEESERAGRDASLASIQARTASLSQPTSPTSPTGPSSLPSSSAAVLPASNGSAPEPQGGVQEKTNE